MRLKSLELTHFKNYEQLSFVFTDENPTVLIGNNGQGKTNFLEAIVILALSKSYQSGPLKDLVRWDQWEGGFFRIKGTVDTQEGEKTLEVFCGRTKQLPKTLKVNDLKVKPKEYVGNLRIVLFTPQDLNLIDYSPQIRRRYVNLFISQIDKEYLEHLSQYQVYLKHRNKLLGQIQEGSAQENELDHWDQHLALHGGYITWKRRQIFDRCNELLSAEYKKISGEAVTLQVTWKKTSYDSSRDVQHLQEAFLSYLHEKHRRDIEVGSTCGGPHRQDFSFEMDGKNVADVASRGECRSTLLALKLAELRLITEETGESPIVLFDDVLSELDPDRQQNLLELFESDQVIITATHLEETPKQGRVCEVQSGIIKG